MNNYDALSDDYSRSHEKPDKKYSMAPTALSIVGSLHSKKVVDVGCGDGFFTKEFAKTAGFVYGIDNSEEQIKKANKDAKNIEYQLVDMNDFTYPSVDVIFAPFVLNYLKKTESLESLFKKFYDSLSSGGLVSGIVDMPQSLVHDMRKFGSIKRIKRFDEGEEIDIELYNGTEHITTLHSFFHKKETIENLLDQIGFTEIAWHNPIISPEGLDIMGSDFWEGYIKNCDLAYFSAKK
jgi:toxoflavin synthase